jgi:hypothetical protein
VRSRILTPEILDQLDPTDPRAVRSRLDLRLLDAWLGNSRWIVRQALRHADRSAHGMIELGAGEGRLCRRLVREFPGAPVTALDLHAPALPSAERGIRWIAGDLLDTLPTVSGSVVVGSMILHHFDDARLHRIGAALGRFDVLIFSEPWRSPVALALASLAAPFAGEVTRHDMPASIRAGFRAGELPALLGLEPATWHVRESVQWRGSLRMLAWRR